MSLSDASRQIALVDATARRTVVKSRLPARMEARRPNVTPKPTAVSSDVAGDGDGSDAVVTDFSLDGRLPKSDADWTNPKTSSSLKVKISKDDKLEEHTVVAPDGKEVTIPRVVNRQIMLLRGVDYIGLANTTTFEDVDDPSWKVGASSELDEKQRQRLQKIG